MYHPSNLRVVAETGNESVDHLFMQHFLYFFPLPHEQGSFGFTFFSEVFVTPFSFATAGLKPAPFGST
jgi:hypothetical protein